MGLTALRVKEIHRQNQIKPYGSWRYIEVLKNETIGLCKKLNSSYIIFYLVLSVYVFFFFTLKAMGPIGCNYMTDRQQRFELKIFVKFYWRNNVTYILNALGVSR